MHQDDDIEKYGCTFDTFRKAMKKYKRISYDVIGPNYDVVMSNSSNNPDNILTLYVNNSHVYPINDRVIQKYIRKTVSQHGTRNVRHVFAKFDEFVVPDKYKYIDDVNMELENGYTYIVNKSVADLGEYMVNLVRETNHSIEYIDMDTSTGRVKKFSILYSIHTSANTTIMN